MWSLLVLTALANPKKDLSAGLKALDEKDPATALRLLDSAIGAGLKGSQAADAHRGRIVAIVDHPDAKTQLARIDSVHADFVGLFEADPNAMWFHQLREEVPDIVRLTDLAVDAAGRGDPTNCAELVPHHARTTPVAVLSAAMRCAVAIQDASAAKGLAKDLLDASKSQDNLEPELLRPLVESADLTVAEGPEPMLKRLDAADAELDAMRKRLDANKAQIESSYDKRLANLENVRIHSLTIRVNVLGDLDDGPARQKPLLLELLRHDPGNYSTHVMLGQVLSQLGENEAALQRLDQAIAIDGTKTSARYLKGVVWVNQATPLQEKLSGMAQDDPAAKKLAAQIDGFFGKARDAFYEALEVDPSASNVVSALEQVCEALEDKACIEKVGSPQ